MKTLSIMLLITYLNVTLASIPTLGGMLGIKQISNNDRHLRWGIAPEKNLSNNFSLLSWNIYKGQEKNFFNDFLDLLEGKDVVLLQEAIGGKFLKKLEDRGMHDGLVFDFSRSFSKDGVATGVGTFSNILPIMTDIFISKFREPIVNTPKVSLLTYYSLENEKKLLVVNTHAINFTLFSAFKNQIDDLFLEIWRHNGPVIFAGDFNTWSFERSIYLFRMAKAHDLMPVFSHVASDFDIDKRTLSAISYYYLDHIFTRGLNITYKKVHKDTASDHDALEVGFEVIDNEVSKVEN